MRGDCGSLGKSMSDANKAAVRGYIEEVMIKGQGDVSKFDTYIQPDVILHNAYPASGSDINAWKDRVRMFAAAFTDMHVAIHDQIAEGDKVVTRTVWSGVHSGHVPRHPRNRPSRRRRRDPDHPHARRQGRGTLEPAGCAESSEADRC